MGLAYRWFNVPTNLVYSPKINFIVNGIGLVLYILPRVLVPQYDVVSMNKLSLLLSNL